jgi:Ser/Thr protein kinase RdoA (MazF antagonist)
MNDIESLVQQAQDQVRILTPLEKAWTSGELPTRITHNDSKLNNLLFDTQGKARCVVDLDTVMPGIVHFDIGDSLRSMSVNLAEGDPNTKDLRIQDEFERQYLRGYTDGDWLTDKERDYLPYAAPYMACIMGVRFLTDYIEGNRYFSIDYPSHNLTRATNQLTLTQLFLKKNRLLN